MAHLQMDNGITLNRLLWRAYCTRVASKLSNDFCFCLKNPKLATKFFVAIANDEPRLFQVCNFDFMRYFCIKSKVNDFFSKNGPPYLHWSWWCVVNVYKRILEDFKQWFDVVSTFSVEIIWQEWFNLDQVLSKALEKSKLDQSHLKVECLVPKGRWWYGFQGDLYRFYVSSKGNDFQMDTCHCCFQERT